MNPIGFEDFWYNSPLFVVVIAGLMVLILEGIRRKNTTASYLVGVLGLVIALVLTGATYGSPKATFNGMMSQGAYGSYFSALFVIVGLFSIVIARNYLSHFGSHHGEYYALILLAVSGMMLMASGTDLIIIFLGIELMSLAFYILAGFFRAKTTSNESALKYFLLGAFATGFLLYGIALLYGVTGSTNLAVIAANAAPLANEPLFLLGVGMLTIALGFKVAAVPFHMWAPDVYEGAPTAVTGFMATAGKAAAFAAFGAVFFNGFAFSGTDVNALLAILAALSMIVGNVTAVVQNNVKRMLAYSSVAHAGYILSGIAAGNAEGQTGMMFYVGAYAFMTLGAFTIVGILEGDDGKGLTYADYTGLGSRNPIAAFLMAIFMFSLAGIPPMAGFFGKYYVFLAAVKADMTWLAVVGVLTSLVSVYYYLRLVVEMYFREEVPAVSIRPSGGSLVIAALAAFMVVQFGIYPSILLTLINGGF
ncbi:MAG: NADH-quinone oxidoreductase subunit N [Ignavibacteriales bacterium]|nr:NADH-quinone oxidoreductase subunit N [Ignavibacteriales bacterium]